MSTKPCTTCPACLVEIKKQQEAEPADVANSLGSNLQWADSILPPGDTFDSEHPYEGAYYVTYLSGSKMTVISGKTWRHLFEAVNYINITNRSVIEGFTPLSDKGRKFPDNYILAVSMS